MKRLWSWDRCFIKEFSLRNVAGKSSHSLQGKMQLWATDPNCFTPFLFLFFFNWAQIWQVGSSFFLRSCLTIMHTKWELGACYTEASASQPASVSVCSCLLPAASLGSCSADCQLSWQPDLPEARQPNATSHRARRCPGLALNHFHTHVHLWHHPPYLPPSARHYTWKWEPFVRFPLFIAPCFSAVRGGVRMVILKVK